MNKYRILSTGFFGVLFLLGASDALPHENKKIHPALTKAAWDALPQTRRDSIYDQFGTYDTVPLFLTRKVEIIEGKSNNVSDRFTIVNWLQQGSIEEDMPDRRCLAHFYNPLADRDGKYGRALSDPIPVTGDAKRDSQDWAMKGEGFSPPAIMFKGTQGENEESWKNARDYYYTALTAPSKDDREKYTAHTFYALGKIVHLLQDLSQPEHVRNDAHMINGKTTPPLGKDDNGDPTAVAEIIGQIIPKARWIENYGEAHGLNIIRDLKNTSPLSPLDWRAAGFKKAINFWDRELYKVDNDAPLNADASGDVSKQLGLAEFTNGNFLGGDASYKELTSRRHNFPHPSLEDTDYNGAINLVKLAGTLSDVTELTPEQEQNGQPLFLAKTKSGISVTHHSRLTYTGFMTMKNGGRGMESAIFPAVTINSASVLQEYHEILLRKAIEYSAGLLDYFFRGKIEANAAIEPTTGLIKLIRVTNRSGDTLKGGEFKLLNDNVYEANAGTVQTLKMIHADGTDFASTDTVADGADIYAICTTPIRPLFEGQTLRVAYKGTIGVDDSHNAKDPDDSGVAVAAAMVNYHYDRGEWPCREVETKQASRIKSGFTFDYVHWYQTASVEGGFLIDNRSITYGGEDTFSIKDYSYSIGTHSNVTDLTPPGWGGGGWNFSLGGTDGSPTATYSDENGSLTWTLSDPYLTDELVALTRQEFLAFEDYYIDYSDNSYYGYSRLGGFGDYSGTLSWLLVPPGDDECEAGRSNYRFRLVIPEMTTGKPCDLSWTERFTPQGGAAIDSLEIYNPGVFRPVVHFSWPTNAGGRQPSAVAVMASDGHIERLELLDPGSGYTSAPTITIEVPAPWVVQATATATIDPSTGAIATLRLGNSGNYLPAVSISKPDVAGGVQATATCTLRADGGLASVTLTNKGNGYANNPSVYATKYTYYNNTYDGYSDGMVRVHVHIGTETKKTAQWDGVLPVNYDELDFTTWPIIGPYRLDEPEVYGQKSIDDVVFTLDTAAP